MTIRAVLTGLAFAASLAACGDDELTPPSGPQEATGVWRGAATVDTTAGAGFGATDSISMVLSEGAGNDITGAGTIRRIRSGDRGNDGSTSRAFTVQGVNIFPEVVLTLRTSASAGTDGDVLINYSGEFISDDLVTGTLNGGGFNNRRIRIRRDPVLIR